MNDPEAKMACGHNESVYRNWADDAPHYCIVCGLCKVQEELKSKELQVVQLQNDKEALIEQRDRAYKERDVATENVSLLLGKLRDQLEGIVKDWGEVFAKHGFPLHRGLTPEQNAKEWANKVQEKDRLNDTLKLQALTATKHVMDLIEAIDRDHHLTEGGERLNGHGSCEVCAIIERGKPLKRKDKVQVCDSCGWRNDGSRVMYTAGKTVKCGNCLPTTR